jgi:hypothetical protein
MKTLLKTGSNLTRSCAAGCLAVVSLCAAPASAQSLCGARDAVVDMLGERYGETVRSVGLAGRDRIVEVFASEETGSWTILVTNSAGVACLVASGQHYEHVATAPLGEPL